MDEETVEIYWLETKSMLNANASKSTTFKTCTTNDLQKFKQKACVNNRAEGPWGVLEKPTQVWKGLKDVKQEQQKCKTPRARFKILQNRQSSFFFCQVWKYLNQVIAWAHAFLNQIWMAE